MSADRWSVCPVCLKRETQKSVELDQQVLDACGKVSAEDYLILVQTAKDFKASLGETNPEETLRHDYECYTTEEGEFYVNHRIGCDVCGLHKKFLHEELLAI